MQQTSDPILDDERVRLGQFFSLSASQQKKKEIIITTKSKICDSEARDYVARCNPKDVVHYPIEEAIDDLLVLFYNDVEGLSLCPPGAVRLMHYQDIERDFKPLLSSLSVEASEAECREALKQASTRKIEDGNTSFVHPANALNELSEYLNSLFYRLCSGELRTEDVVQCDLHRGKVSFELPALSAIFEQHEETRPLLTNNTLSRRLSSQARHFNPRTGRWVSGRQIFRPLATVSMAHA